MVDFMFFSIPFSPQQMKTYLVVLYFWMEREIRHSSEVMGCYPYATVEMTSFCPSDTVEFEHHLYYQ